MLLAAQPEARKHPRRAEVVVDAWDALVDVEVNVLATLNEASGRVARRALAGDAASEQWLRR